MFCSKCGSELPDNSQFCSKCGSEISGQPKVVDDSKPLHVTQPVFIGWVSVFSVLPITFFASIWAAGFLGIMSNTFMRNMSIGIPEWFMPVFWGCIALFGIPGLTYYAHRKTYAQTVYRFYQNKLEYFEGFFTVEEKTILYKNVNEVYLRRGIIQRGYDLGTIVLSTPATGWNSSRARSGIRIVNIKNPEKVYKAVKELVHRADR